MATLIELKDVTKEFDGQVVLRGIDLVIEPNEFVTLLGPSGCGKTTTLRIIGGFIDASEGGVYFNGQSMTEIPVHKRPTNTVFQRYALFPHLDVYENVAFGLRIKDKNNNQKKQIRQLKTKLKKDLNELKNDLRQRKLELKSLGLTKEKIKEEEIVAKNKYDELASNLIETCEQQIIEIKQTFINNKDFEQLIKNKVTKYLKMVGLEGFERRPVHLLSGGQQQRVAIARALINEPEVLLLDEPLAALDLKLRQEMQYELKELQRRAGITFIFVTHDQEEALTMSDTIVVINNGLIQQVGTPIDIYNEPKNRFVANFIGESNIVDGFMRKDYLVDFSGSSFECVDAGFAKDEAVDVVIRPEDLVLIPAGNARLTGTVSSVNFLGVHYEMIVESDDGMSWLVHSTLMEPVGTKVGLGLEPMDIHIMRKESPA